ncbi:MAG: 4Fe-4S binding protein [Dehalococcoidia bacterium]|nr:4Fe-4S binding protein [Dehalococcoidia bacterium]
MHDVYEQLAFHLSTLGMGLPYREELLEILWENLTPTEAKVLLALPTKVAPLQPVGVDKIASNINFPREQLVDILESLSERGLLFSGKTKKGEKGYALQQVGFGFPQTFFWKVEDTPQAKHMANLVAKYFNRRVTSEAYGSSKTKPFRYIPVGETIDHATQAVFPYHMMEEVMAQARVFAVAHCACRIAMRLQEKGCDHPLEVCLKFDDMAEYTVERGLAREVTKEEALEIIRKSEEAGLVHFVDNAIKGIKLNCNCCGCACWNVGSIKRRKIPRDVLMATYFIRETDKDKCIGCGNCVEICPVDAIVIEGDYPAVDEEWCIGCGLCVRQCSSEAAKLRLRTDRTDHSPLPDFVQLHGEILKEKGLV